MLDHPSPASGAHRSYGVERRGTDSAILGEDAVAEEAPVALVYNGFSHAVMLATPQDLEDFALGFTLSEGIAASARELHDIDVVEHALGCEVRMALASERFAAMRERRRALAGRTGCGLCGIESLAQLQRPLPPARLADTAIQPGALERAQAELAALQPLFQLTGAVHAAAWCRRDGSVALVREDVGRHNALDKLIGAIATRGCGFDDGFVLMTSRASYEIVQKAATVGIAAIAALSAPTGMAVRLAEAAGVTLVGFARGHRHSVYTHPQRMH
ncbi:formate dehydrogenase accessory sulfurtransferase FdhD [Thauera aminoaromatica]|jgi:phenylacetyl-CoA:acceptor oxidoreductase accessory protein|uniref:Sulfur carrier protein FdhD n=2 Tax=Thauera aminoaromatica TaxID=164330 RepID=N6YYB9_THASP|nr:formate dehydrogenase accessory sulfurtransferase FdhD [Thauera aminoaromatica]ACK52995.1 formate dehydrogenase family accessory protein FdhD [Thauera aminoaromatica]ENO87372.1 formate dehydrogenase family accessory protein FdhD [Thauera aminoaromatica S2]MCK6399787.1 formate dehydrogenase accessory sulfurtransferase FdhD [Thauera aminoaromatica]